MTEPLGGGGGGTRVTGKQTGRGRRGNECKERAMKIHRTAAALRYRPVQKVAALPARRYSLGVIALVTGSLRSRYAKNYLQPGARRRSLARFRDVLISDAD